MCSEALISGGPANNDKVAISVTKFSDEALTGSHVFWSINFLLCEKQPGRRPEFWDGYSGSPSFSMLAVLGKACCPWQCSGCCPNFLSNSHPWLQVVVPLSSNSLSYLGLTLTVLEIGGDFHQILFKFLRLQHHVQPSISLCTISNITTKMKIWIYRVEVTLSLFFVFPKLIFLLLVLLGGRIIFIMKEIGILKKF